MWFLAVTDESHVDKKIQQGGGKLYTLIKNNTSNSLYNSYSE